MGVSKSKHRAEDEGGEGENATQSHKKNKKHWGFKKKSKKPKGEATEQSPAEKESKYGTFPRRGLKTSLPRGQKFMTLMKNPKAWGHKDKKEDENLEDGAADVKKSGSNPELRTEVHVDSSQAREDDHVIADDDIMKSVEAVMNRSAPSSYGEGKTVTEVHVTRTHQSFTESSAGKSPESHTVKETRVEVREKPFVPPMVGHSMKGAIAAMAGDTLRKSMENVADFEESQRDDKYKHILEEGGTPARRTDYIKPVITEYDESAPAVEESIEKVEVQKDSSEPTFPEGMGGDGDTEKEAGIEYAEAEQQKLSADAKGDSSSGIDEEITPQVVNEEEAGPPVDEELIEAQSADAVKSVPDFPGEVKEEAAVDAEEQNEEVQLTEETEETPTAAAEVAQEDTHEEVNEIEDNSGENVEPTEEEAVHEELTEDNVTEAPEEQVGESPEEQVASDIVDQATAEGTEEAAATIDSEDAPAEDAPAEDAPAEDAPAEDAPAEDAPAEDAPAEDAPAEDAPAEDAPAEDAPAEDAPAEDAPAEDAPAEDAPAEDAPAEDAPAEDAPAEDAPAEDAPSDELPPAVFTWEHGGESVLVTGSFNEWGEQLPLEASDEGFKLSLPLPEGRHEYKYVVDGEWKANPSQEMDGENNIIEICK